jgi:hypothetical protein
MGRNWDMADRFRPLVLQWVVGGDANELHETERHQRIPRPPVLDEISCFSDALDHESQAEHRRLLERKRMLYLASDDLQGGQAHFWQG